MVHASPHPAPAALRARRLALFGGSFDPPHRGHLAMAEAAIEARELDHVLWVPAASPPHKPQRTLARPAERVRMLELLLQGRSSERHSIWTVELERGGVSFTVETLRAIRAELDDRQGTELHLVLGTDNLDGLERWREIDEIVPLARAIVLPRADPDGRAARALAALPSHLARWVRAGSLDVPTVEVSSTELRGRLARGEAPGSLVPEALGAYLVERGAYGGRGRGSGP